MTIPRSFVLVAIVGTLLSICCSSVKAEQTKRYDLKGTVVSTDIGNGELTVDMEAIPGYMDAMKMPYKVTDMAVLKSLKKGDRIRATVVVKKDDEHLENVQVMSGTQSTATK
jgi:protein SCO1/2